MPLIDTYISIIMPLDSSGYGPIVHMGLLFTFIDTLSYHFRDLNLPPLRLASPPYLLEHYIFLS